MERGVVEYDSYFTAVNAYNFIYRYACTHVS